MNFLSHVFLIKTFLPQLKSQKQGDLILLGSESGLKGPAKQSIYAASKSALRTFAQSLRSECTTKNVRVTCINPGAVKTDMLKIAPFSLSYEETHHIAPEDIAEVIAFLLGIRVGTVFDEINLSPQKHRLRAKVPQEDIL